MAEIQGSKGRDVVTVMAGDRFYGNEGDDEIILLHDATGQGGPGNDTLIVSPDANWATVWYWSSPNVIYVDL